MATQISSVESQFAATVPSTMRAVVYRGAGPMAGASVGAIAVLVRSARELLEVIPMAFRLAASGRPGPVLVDVPPPTPGLVPVPPLLLEQAMASKPSETNDVTFR